jgi:hypothetical protein
MEQVTLPNNGFAAQVKALVEPELEQLGKSIAERVPHVRWHAEFPRSRVLEFRALLVFTSDADTTTELAVVSIEFQREPEPRLAMDVTDAESMPLREGTDIDANTQRELAADPALAGHVASEFLRGSADAIVHALDVRS